MLLQGGVQGLQPVADNHTLNGPAAFTSLFEAAASLAQHSNIARSNQANCLPLTFNKHPGGCKALAVLFALHIVSAALSVVRMQFLLLSLLVK